MADPKRPWLKGPGELCDSKGVPIYPGDLLRTPHYRDRRRRQHYLYHTAVYHDDGQCKAVRMVPTQYLDPSVERTGGECMLTDLAASGCEVIAGHGPGDCLDYTDRLKARRKEG